MDHAKFMYSVNPATGERIAEYPVHSADESDRRLSLAARAFAEWSRQDVSARAAVVARAGALLRERREKLSRLATLEMGKTLASAEAEVDKCAWACEHFAEHAPAMLADIRVETGARDTHVRHDPLGVLLAIMPWNFPYWQAFRAAVPAIAAGNTVALKHASNVCGCALAMEDVWRDAGLPPGGFTVLLVPGGARASALATHPSVAAVTLTGSEPAGASVAEAAGRALKKIVLELGGSDPFLVLADAAVAAAAKQAAGARVINNGQSCIAAKRFIVVEDVADEFESAFETALRGLIVGDPMQRDTDVGPLARADLVEDLDRQVRASVLAGASCVLGGQPFEGPGWFYPPTLLTGVAPGMPAFDEETFGPLAAVTRARDTRHAVELANQSRFGLGASLWATDLQVVREVTAALEVGNVFVNTPVKSDPRLPFGGVRRSGHGRELGPWGLREFVNVKTVWVE
jgi:succinate-semialdehyde dehydrogenase/glutarate-semialdehyde dehydrogenase